jgi:hypothetical protein
MMTRAKKTSSTTTRLRPPVRVKAGPGSYVGEASSDDAIDAGETGAEARSEQKNR